MIFKILETCLFYGGVLGLTKRVKLHSSDWLTWSSGPISMLIWMTNLTGPIRSREMISHFPANASEEIVIGRIFQYF